MQTRAGGEDIVDMLDKGSWSCQALGQEEDLRGSSWIKMKEEMQKVGVTEEDARDMLRCVHFSDLQRDQLNEEDKESCIVQDCNTQHTVELP